MKVNSLMIIFVIFTLLIVSCGEDGIEKTAGGCDEESDNDQIGPGQGSGGTSFDDLEKSPIPKIVLDCRNSKYKNATIDGLKWKDGIDQLTQNEIDKQTITFSKFPLLEQVSLDASKTCLQATGGNCITDSEKYEIEYLWVMKSTPTPHNPESYIQSLESGNEINYRWTTGDEGKKAFFYGYSATNTGIGPGDSANYLVELRARAVVPRYPNS